MIKKTTKITVAKMALGSKETTMSMIRVPPFQAFDKSILMWASRASGHIRGDTYGGK
jgi:hypothetical protein